MKRKQLKIWLLLLTVGAIFAACEGPAGVDGLNGADGAAGTDGADGASGNATCMSCHSGDTKSNIEAQFATSGHDAGLAVKYADYGPNCSGCHSHQGFVQFATLGSIGSINHPTAWECATCHGLHKTMEATDYALRLSDPVTSMSDNTHTLDMGGNSNLCVNCHQARKPEPNIVTPGEATFTIPRHFGPHYGVQGNVVYGVGLAEIAGSVSYPIAGESKHLTQASCTGCHMSEFSSENAQGGHSFIPSQNACNTCHDAEDSDYEHNGARLDFDNKMIDLRDELVRLGVVVETAPDEFDFAEGETFSMVEAQAGYNWHGLYQDHSHGAHNPVYINAILMNSIEALKAIPDPIP